MDEQEFRAFAEREYAKYIESTRAVRKGAHEKQSAIALSQLILAEARQAGRLEMIRELISIQGMGV